MIRKKLTTEHIEEFIRHLRVFELLDSGYIAQLARLVKVRQYNKGEILWLQGQQVEEFSIVYKGRLRSVRGSVSGSEKLVAMLPVGYHFGLAEMVTSAVSAVTLLADTDSIILQIDNKSLENMLLSNADICYAFMQTMARTIFALTQELERASFETVQTRLARLLLRTCPDQRHSTDPDYRSPTHIQLAMRLGVSRETITRVLADFKKKKLIDTAYRSIIILDRDRLMELIEDFDQW